MEGFFSCYSTYSVVVVVVVVHCPFNYTHFLDIIIDFLSIRIHVILS